MKQYNSDNKWQNELEYKNIFFSYISFSIIWGKTDLIESNIYLLILTLHAWLVINM